MTKLVTVEVADHAIEMFGGDEKRFAREMYETAVVKWFDEFLLSQGQASELLGIPNSLADRLAATLCRVYPKMKMGVSSGCLQTPVRGKVGAGGIVCYEDFSSFIQSEL
jgi:predicted XRE-type DNA-binding protein